MTGSGAPPARVGVARTGDPRSKGSFVLTSVPRLEATDIASLVGFPDLVAALRSALLDPDGPAGAGSPPRTHLPVAGGHVLLMPAADRRRFGIKVAGVAPDNPSRGLPRITGTYLLHDAETLQPVLLLDGPALTLWRTAALSALAVEVLAPAETTGLVLFGTGPQAAAHLSALRSLRPGLRATVVGRTREGAESFAATHGVDIGSPADVAGADLVICCTSAAAPLFDGRLLAADATVVAMGSHTLDCRELDDATFDGAQVVVEERDTALREAADVRSAVGAGLIARWCDLADVVTGRVSVEPSGRRIFRSVGMAWEDLVVAAALEDRWSSREASVSPL